MKQKTLANKQQAEENTPGSVQIMNKGSAAEETAKAHDQANEGKHSGMSEASHERNLSYSGGWMRR